VDVDFYFDFSCPFAYLGSEEIEGLCARLGATLRWRPMLLGGVFRAIGEGEGPMATLPPAKALHTTRDALRWAERRGVPLRYPPAHPMRTVRALRVLLGLPEASWPAAIHAIYRAYWRDNLDITQADVIAAVLRDAGVDATAALAGADSPAIKAELFRRTDEAVARGVFGAPAIFTGDVMLWGQDRLHWLEAIARGWNPDGGAPPGGVISSDPGPAGSETGRQVDFWYDFSSPFAYLGSTQIEAVCRRAGATLRWRPLLLGALFKQVGGPDVPLFAMPEAKRRYIGGELARWASWWQVPFRFSSHFPLRTVTPLRMAIAAGADAPALIHRLFRAAWVDNEDLADEATLRRLAGEAGLDPGLVDRTRDPAIKQALVDLTAEARDTGVFGVPTCVVRDPAGPLVFWGQDRLDLVEAALGGWRPAAG
jgi:2-hydroxychromene-2-carboxylate isomerase